MIRELRTDFPLPVLLEIAELPRATFYFHQQKLGEQDKYCLVKEHIRAKFDEHRGRYGYRRMTTELKKLGHQLNSKTVQRLMGVLGLKSLVRPKRYCSFKGEVGEAAPNELDRQFEATSANQKWVTDVTEFKVNGEKLYLSPVLDLYNGEIIVFETSRRPVLDMVKKMLDKAIAKLRPDEAPLLHSDQGWHYRMPLYKATLRERGMVQSMSRKGNCHDNATMESFFAVLKTEFFYLEKFNSIEELTTGLRDYIHYYNYDRIKLKLNGLSPVEYRTQSLGA